VAGAQLRDAALREKEGRNAEARTLNERNKISLSKRTHS
jgi:hypothetical protein